MMDGSSQLGWAWYPDNIQAVINTAWAASQSEGIRTVYTAHSWVPICSLSMRNKSDPRSRWIAEKKRKLGIAKACVAVANKNAPIIWALLAHDEPYRRA